MQYFKMLKVNKLRIGLIILVAFIYFNSLKAQQVIPLYDQPIPGSINAPNYKEHSSTGEDGVIRISQVSRPTLQVFKPTDTANAHTAVIICPGGGYQILAYNLEGTEIAKRLASWGITAFVLKYRLPDDQIMKDKSFGPLMDAERAIMMVRAEAGKWNIRPDRIGIMGFSAGGHLAASLSNLYHLDLLGNLNPKQVSLRPDFSILGYPVISMEDDITHQGSKTALLGASPSRALVQKFSLERQVTDRSPATFIVLASDDPGVPPANSLRYITALQQQQVPVELHMYQNGGHGFGGENKQSPDDWMLRLKHWLEQGQWLPHP